VSAGLLPASWPVVVSAVSGYSGGGKAMITEFEDAQSENYTEDNHRIYALGQAHKHPPEMKKFSKLANKPVFMPSVGRYAQGMIVEIGLPLWALPGKPTRAQVHSALTAAYAGERFVNVPAIADCDAQKGVEPEACNGTNRIDLFVFGSDEEARLVARFDNLGKGASGAAVQNLNIALGLDEDAGLSA
ncbi:MAG TPA: N-acetyl-gamma-glutamyl-phosphate reductase, partial [Hyphomonas atlantica]|nr:N-acetyl-gamma-glutamyl-phosphate reductase [Hyphomonas atlantica]